MSKEQRIDFAAAVALVAIVLVAFDDIVFRNLDQILAGLPTGVPNRDSLVVLFPFFEHFIDSLAGTGHLDPWNPYIWGGSPAIGNPNIPFNIVLYAFFHLSRPAFVVAMNWHLVTEFVLAGLGVYFLLRRLGTGVVSALLAALLSLFSTSALWMTNTFCIFFHWVVIPWALYLLLTAPERGRFCTIAWLGTLFYYQLTYGQAQMTLYTLFFVGLCVTWLLKESFDRKLALTSLAGGVLLGAALALHFLLPMAEYLRLAGDRSTETWAETARHYQVNWRYLLNLIFPRLFWKPIPWWPVWRDGWTAWESFNVSLGPFFGLVAGWMFLTSKSAPVRRMGVFAALILVLSTTEWGGRCLVALNLGRTVPFSRVTHLLLYPLLFAVASPWYLSRRQIGGLAIVVGVAGVGAIFLSRDFSAFIHGFFDAAVTAGHYSAARAAQLSQTFIHEQRGNFADAFLHDLIILFACSLFLSVAYFLFHRARVRNLFLAAVILLPLVDQAAFFSTRRQRGTEPFPFRATLRWDNPLVQALEARRADFDRYLFSTFTGRMELDTGLAPNQNASLKIPSANGYTSFNHYRDPRFHRGNWGYAFPEAELRASGVKYILIGPETPRLAYAARLIPLAAYREYRLVEYRDAQARYRFEAVPAGCAPNVVMSGTTARLENDCAAAVPFRFPDFRYPWWHAFLDGRAIPTAGPVLVAPGSHVFELRCRPVSWYAGIAGSVATLVALVACVVWRRRDALSRPLPRLSPLPA